jgi:hypothetical protein
MRLPVFVTHSELQVQPPGVVQALTALSSLLFCVDTFSSGRRHVCSDTCRESALGRPIKGPQDSHHYLDHLQFDLCSFEVVR